MKRFSLINDSSQFQKRASIICAFLLLLPFMLAAQTNDDVWKRPLNAETLPRFNAICKEMSRHRILRGRFIQTNTLNRLGRSLVSNGNFTADAERGIIWDTKTPFPSVTVVGRASVVQISGGRTTRLDTSGNETFIRISEAISSIFAGDSEKLINAFELYFTENGRNWNLGLLPRDNEVKAVAKAIIMQGDSVLRELIFYQQNGDIIRYELSGHSFPAELSADEKALFAH
jgi:hypothetical protein